MDSSYSGLYFQNVTCELFEGEGFQEVVCENVTYSNAEIKYKYTDQWFWIFLGVYVFLVLFAGLMSGLTIGLMSLDKMSLKILQVAGTAKDRKYAQRILPLVQRHHLLLVTLLLANAAAVEAMPIFLNKITNEVIAVVVSVTAVLFFGEVVPQALCTRFGLAIGAYLAPLVWFLIGIFFIFAWPIAMLLDCSLGKGRLTFFGRAELKALVGLHGERNSGSTTNLLDDPLSADEVQIIQGALDMHRKVAGDAMITLNDVFMLDVNASLDHKLRRQIREEAHSRIPLYENRQENIVGVLLVKNLIDVDLHSPVPLRTLMTHTSFRDMPSVAEDRPLYELLNEFQTGKSHMFSVYRVDYGAGDRQMVGIITLEDIIEELIQEEIFDEMDKYREMVHRIHMSPSHLARVLSSRSFRRTSSSSTSRGNESSRSTEEGSNSHSESSPLLYTPYFH